MFNRKGVLMYLTSQIYPSNFVPSPCHKFIKLVEDRGKVSGQLLRYFLVLIYVYIIPI